MAQHRNGTDKVVPRKNAPVKAPKVPKPTMVARTKPIIRKGKS